jgi:DNA-binding response OmpR family regulator
MKPGLLIVEDDADLREFLVMMLSDRGDAVGAGTGEEGVALADSRPTDVVLLDFMLPGLRGWDLLRALQDRPAPPIVILVTGYADEKLMAEAPARGAFAVFGKPFSLEALLAKVEEAIAVRRRQLAITTSFSN